MPICTAFQGATVTAFIQTYEILSTHAGKNHELQLTWDTMVHAMCTLSMYMYIPSACVESSSVGLERLVPCTAPWTWSYWRMEGGGEKRCALNRTSMQTAGTRHDWEPGDRETRDIMLT